MTIAVIGWGSLIWLLKPLEIATWWRKDGPELPIEFARISNDGRLTLVIYPGAGKSVQTYWAISLYDKLPNAIDNLRAREGHAKCPIHSLDRQGNTNCPDPQILQIVRAWLDSRPRLDAVIWTGLQDKWNWTGGAYTPDNVIRYLQSVDRTVSEKARKYITNAPPQIRTPLRSVIEDRMGWSAQSLPSYWWTDFVNQLKWRMSRS